MFEKSIICLETLKGNASRCLSNSLSNLKCNGTVISNIINFLMQRMNSNDIILCVHRIRISNYSDQIELY